MDSFLFETALGEIDPAVIFSPNIDSEEAVFKIISGDGQRPDLLFLDWNMPKMTGKDCLKAIRNHPVYTSVPIIIAKEEKAGG